jgi:hypothetical protein
MRPEISDEVKEMVETSADKLLDNPALSIDDLTFEQKIRLVCVGWWEETGEFGDRPMTNAPWNQ